MNVGRYWTNRDFNLDLGIPMLTTTACFGKRSRPDGGADVENIVHAFQDDQRGYSY